MTRSAPLLALVAVLAAGLGLAGPASAQDRHNFRRGFRSGIAVPVERAAITCQKAVDNTDPGTLVPAPRGGAVFGDGGSVEGPQGP